MNPLNLIRGKVYFLDGEEPMAYDRVTNNGIYSFIRESDSSFVELKKTEVKSRINKFRKK